MRAVVYALKRTFGVTATIIVPRNRAVDRDSGSVTQESDEYTIPRIVCLPERHAWTAAQISRSLPTIVDANYRKGDKEFLVDRRDYSGPWTDKTIIDVQGTEYHTVSHTTFPDAFYVIGRQENQ
jgi:hypothetical protein